MHKNWALLTNVCFETKNSLRQKQTRWKQAHILFEQLLIWWQRITGGISADGKKSAQLRAEFVLFDSEVSVVVGSQVLLSRGMALRPVVAPISFRFWRRPPPSPPSKPFDYKINLPVEYSLWVLYLLKVHFSNSSKTILQVMQSSGSFQDIDNLTSEHHPQKQSDLIAK